MLIDFDLEAARWREAQAKISDLAKDPRPLRFALNSGGTVLVSRDLNSALWRMTAFNTQGEPTGHIGPCEYERAVHEARKFGADVLDAERMTLA